jgi:hypothetical protein
VTPHTTNIAYQFVEEGFLDIEEAFVLGMVFMNVMQLEFCAFALNGFQRVNDGMKVEKEGGNEKGGSKTQFCFQLYDILDIVV